MLLDYFNGNFSWYGLVSRIMDIAEAGGSNAAYNFFSNFVSNVVTAVTNKGNLWGIISILPDFFYMIAKFFPIGKAVTLVYQIAMLF